MEERAAKRRSSRAQKSRRSSRAQNSQKRRITNPQSALSRRRSAQNRRGQDKMVTATATKSFLQLRRAVYVVAIRERCLFDVSFMVSFFFRLEVHLCPPVSGSTAGPWRCVDFGSWFCGRRLSFQENRLFRATLIALSLSSSNAIMD